jgi:lysophospholipase L1-like esterase
MGRPGRTALVAGAVACALATAVAAPAAQASRTLLVYGDSLVVGTGLFLPATLAGWPVRTVRDVVRIAGPRGCVIWSTIARPPYDGVSYDGYNRALRRIARARPSLRVFDWQALSRDNPQWFGSDGVHPSAAGYRARATALARLVKTCP